MGEEAYQRDSKIYCLRRQVMLCKYWMPEAELR